MADETKEPIEGAPEDPRGEDLTSVHLPDDVADYEIASDETEAEELTDASPVEADEMVDDTAQLSDAEQVAAAARSTRPKKRKQVRAEAEAAGQAVESTTVADIVAANAHLRPKRVPAKKTAPTPSRNSRTSTAVATQERVRRVGPAQFVRECIDELRKVVWPTGEQLSQYFIVVLIFVLFIIAYVSVLDTGFGMLLLKLLG